MAHKMQTYDETSTTKGHPSVPQESQDFVLRSTLGERKYFLRWKNTSGPGRPCDPGGPAEPAPP